MAQYFVSTFYFFKPLEQFDLAAIEQKILTHGTDLDINGLFILGREGLNSTFAAPSKDQCDKFKQWISDYFEVNGLSFKDSVSAIKPFPKVKVKIRREICTIGGVKPRPFLPDNFHLSPESWDRVLTQEKDFVLIDTRNDYEYRIGTFRGAINPNIEQFTEFPTFVENQGFTKDKKILLFCTGGIRCEKAVVDLQNRGFTEVHQLKGGILNYLSKFPNSEFLGECFVFDNRVALDQRLIPTQVYKLCPHCGQPAELQISCVRCDSQAIICPTCHPHEVEGKTCSKNCAHHYRLAPSKKGQRQIRPWELGVESSIFRHLKLNLRYPSLLE